jgi:hypothetical protein
VILKELKRLSGGDFLRMKMRLLKTNGLKKHFAVIVRGWVENRWKMGLFREVRRDEWMFPHLCS